ncbi:MAG TPA: DUF364 domain-containing protein [Chloroflexota bacterium]|nr:DUF364 domain-containing protein [Chloroflexota bacterium]
MGLLADLVQSVQHTPPLFATHLVIGPRFTAIGAAPQPGAHRPTAGGVAYTGAADGPGPFDTGAATRTVEQGVLSHPLSELAYGLLDGQPPTPRDPAVVRRPDVGAAALNALLAAQLRATQLPLGDENGLHLLTQESRGRRLAIVGRFPNLAQVRSGAARSWVLELRPEGDELPASAAAEVLPQADAVGITGSTLANGTLEGLLALCRPDAFVLLLGPTTPLSPVLFEYGVDVLCGTLVEDPLRVVEQLAGEPAIPTPRLPGMRPVSLRPGRGGP